VDGSGTVSVTSSHVGSSAWAWGQPFVSFLFQTLRYIAGKRHSMPADAMASAEDSAQKAAMEALSRKDVLSARELLRPFVSKSQRPDLLALQGIWHSYWVIWRTPACTWRALRRSIHPIR